MVGPQKYYKPLPCHPRARFMGSLPVGFWMTSGLPLISYDYYIFAALDCVFPQGDFATGHRIWMVWNNHRKMLGKGCLFTMSRHFLRIAAETSRIVHRNDRVMVFKDAGPGSYPFLLIPKRHISTLLGVGRMVGPDLIITVLAGVPKI